MAAVEKWAGGIMACVAGFPGHLRGHRLIWCEGPRALTRLAFPGPGRLQPNPYSVALAAVNDGDRVDVVAAMARLADPGDVFFLGEVVAGPARLG